MKAALLTIAVVLTCHSITTGQEYSRRTPPDQFVEALMAARGRYVEGIEKAGKLHIADSPWIDSMCLRIRLIDHTLRLPHDSSLCPKVRICHPGDVPTQPKGIASWFCLRLFLSTMIW